ncbi:MAG TPA: hypothetical protein VK191_06180 [Symbiobacteriaceae bacterium]|nr:hypothetical protein [Symbiobacteriaceae bacterium]
MAIVSATVRPQAQARGPAADRHESRARLTAATVIALGCIAFFLGLTWDVQWHAAVGPDSFFTAPHGLLYSGPALGGIISLLVVIATTTKYHKGAPGVTDGNTTPWLRYFRAPVGFIVTGLGALSFLVGGLFDLWWHTLYGFDVTLLSPAHFFLLFSMLITLIGMTYTFASEVNRAYARGERGTYATVGFALILALLMNVVGVFLFIGLYDAVVAGGLLVYAVSVALLFPLGLVAASTFVRRFGGATLTALFFTALRVIALYWPLKMVEFLRQIDGLPYKVGAPMSSIPARAMPVYLILFALVIDGAVALGRKYRLSQRLVVAGGAALATLINFLLDPRWMTVLTAWKESPTGLTKAEMADQIARATLPSAIVAVVLAALVGLFGAGYGKVLRSTDK